MASDCEQYIDTNFEKLLQGDAFQRIFCRFGSD